VRPWPPAAICSFPHADVSRAHAVGTERRSETARELVDANQALVTVPARARDEIGGYFGDWTLVEPGLTDIWAWRQEDDPVANTSGFMRILGGVARKDPGRP
jgi:hypothetical protein